MAELGGAQGEACEGSWRGHVGVRWREGRLELVGVVGVSRLGMLRDGWRGKEPVWVWSRVPWVVGVGAYAKGHLVNYSASLGMGETIAVLDERGRWARGQDGVGSGVEGAAGGIRQQGVCVGGG